jgi:hypothetical protein
MQEKQTGAELATPISRRVSTHSVRSVCSRDERTEPLDVEPPLVAPLAAESPAPVRSLMAAAMQQRTVHDPQHTEPSEPTEPAPPTAEAPHADASADETPEVSTAVPLDPEQAMFEEFRTMRHPHFVSPNKAATVQPPLPPPSAAAAAPVVTVHMTKLPEDTPAPPPLPAPSQRLQPTAPAPTQPAIAPPPAASTPQQAVHPPASPFQPQVYVPTSWAQLPPPPPPPPPPASPLQYPPHYGAPYAQPPSGWPSIEGAVPMIAVANGVGAAAGVGAGGEQRVRRTAGGELVELVDALTECLDNDRGWMQDMFDQLDTDEDGLLSGTQVLDLVQLVMPRVTDRQVRRDRVRWREGKSGTGYLKRWVGDAAHVVALLLDARRTDGDGSGGATEDCCGHIALAAVETFCALSGGVVTLSPGGVCHVVNS